MKYIYLFFLLPSLSLALDKLECNYDGNDGTFDGKFIEDAPLNTVNIQTFKTDDGRTILFSFQQCRVIKKGD